MNEAPTSRWVTTDEAAAFAARPVATNPGERRQSANLENYVDVTVAARYLSVASKTLNQLAREGKIPAYPWGVGTQRRSWRFKLSELDSWMRSRLVSECHPLPNRRRK